MKRGEGKVGKGDTCVTTISAKSNFIELLNTYSLNEFKGENKQVTIHLPIDLKAYYYKSIPRGKRSKVLVSMVEALVVELKEYNVGQVFISASSLVRHGILFDMIRPIKERILTMYILDRFFEKIAIMKKNRLGVKGYRSPKVCIGNILHPNGEWQKYYSNAEIRRLDTFRKLYKKVSKYYTERFVSKYYMKFLKADQLGLLNNIQTILDLKNLYNLIKCDK